MCTVNADQFAEINVFLNLQLMFSERKKIQYYAAGLYLTFIAYTITCVAFLSMLLLSQNLDGLYIILRYYGYQTNGCWSYIRFVVVLYVWYVASVSYRFVCIFMSSEIWHRMKLQYALAAHPFSPENYDLLNQIALVGRIVGKFEKQIICVGKVVLFVLAAAIVPAGMVLQTENDFGPLIEIIAILILFLWMYFCIYILHRRLAKGPAEIHAQWEHIRFQESMMSESRLRY